MVSFRDQIQLEPRPDWPPSGVYFKFPVRFSNLLYGSPRSLYLTRRPLELSDNDRELNPLSTVVNKVSSILMSALSNEVEIMLIVILFFLGSTARGH